MFQHDSAPPHYSREVRQLLFENYPGRWMVASVKLQFHGLHNHLTWSFSIFLCGDIW
jgi:hypothetical protein